MLPAVPLVEETYKGILGYHSYLQQQGDVPLQFLHDALHDLTECLHLERSGFPLSDILKEKNTLQISCSDPD